MPHATLRATSVLESQLSERLQLPRFGGRSSQTRREHRLPVPPKFRDGSGTNRVSGACEPSVFLRITTEAGQHPDGPR